MVKSVLSAGVKTAIVTAKAVLISEDSLKARLFDSFMEVYKEYEAGVLPSSYNFAEKIKEEVVATYNTLVNVGILSADTDKDAETETCADADEDEGIVDDLAAAVNPYQE